MAGVSIIINDEDVQKTLGEVASRMEDPTPAFKILGEIGRSSMVRNFEKEGRPEKWKELADSTLKGKKSRYILREQGAAGGLMGSISAKAMTDRVVIGTNKVYAAIHHFGGQAGRGLKTTIPARPYMMLQDEDMEEMQAELTEFIMRA